MKTEFEKAKRASYKKSHPTNFQTWWKKNRLTVLRIVFFPIWLGTVTIDKLEHIHYERLKKKNEWDEERAKEILDYFVFRNGEWREDTHTLVLYARLPWHASKPYLRKYLKRKDRCFWERFAYSYIRHVLINSYELAGFTKEPILDWDGEVDYISFIQNPVNE